MSAQPWDVVGSHEQLFVLVTGANSGVGLGIGGRLIDEFLASRSLSSHLILIPTTRSLSKSRETVEVLREHVRKTASSLRTLISRAGPSYDPQDTINRVHILSVQLDLCNLSNVYAVAHRLVQGTVSDPTDENGARYKIPRLDSVVMNAGIGGFYGLDWPVLIRKFLTEGLLQMCTFPDFKLAHSGLVVKQEPTLPGTPELPVLGEVFCANVLGHYILVHELLPLLSRASPETTPGRIVWTGSIEPTERSLRLDDFQGVQTEAPYESSKRLTDLLALTHQLPAAQKYTGEYLAIEDPKMSAERPIRPTIYLTHPGVVHTTLFPLVWPLITLYKWALIFCRWLGSPWHPVESYIGAAAPVWMVLQDQENLDALDAQRVKWGTSTDVWAQPYIKKTEVEGWGWEGKVVDREELNNDPETRVLRKLQGRRPTAKDLTKEQLEEFEETGAKCWQEMERLRHEWERMLGVRASARVEGEKA